MRKESDLAGFEIERKGGERLDAFSFLWWCPSIDYTPVYVSRVIVPVAATYPVLDVSAYTSKLS